MRSVWTGTIAFGLVNIPVKLYSAVQESSLDLDMLDRKDHAHIRYQRVNENTGRQVPWEQIAKAYNYNDKYVILEEADFEEASPQKSKTIEIQAFVEESEIESIYYESPYYLEPGKDGGKAYGLLLKALERSKKVGVSRFVFRSKEHLSVVRVHQKVLLLQRIRFPEEIRSTKELKLPKDITVSKKEIDMALSLINEYTAHFDISQYKDEYSKELLKIIKAKAGGKRPIIKKMKVVNTKSSDLLEQLKASLGNKKRAS